MNKETPYREQAEKRRKKIDRNDASEASEELPPRQEVHGQKRHKNKWKVKYPIIRLLVLFFILMPISMYSAYSYLKGNNGGFGGAIKSSGGYERIQLEIEDTKTEQKQSKESPLNTFTEKKGEGEKTILEPAELDMNEIPATDGKSTPVKYPVKESKIPIKVDDNNHSKPTIETESSNVVSEKNERVTEGKEMIYHTVKKGENLYRISLKYYQSRHGMEIIRNENNLQGDEVMLGQVLKIPLTN